MQRHHVLSLCFLNTIRNRLSTSEGLLSVVISNWFTKTSLSFPLTQIILHTGIGVSCYGLQCNNILSLMGCTILC